MAEAAIKMPSPRPRLHMGRRKMASDAYNTHLADIPSGTDPKVVVTPSYWAHFVDYIKPMDVVVAFWEDGTYEAWYRVLFTTPMGVTLSMLFDKRHEETVEQDENAPLVVKWRGAGGKWAVVRKTDTGIVVIKDKLPSQAEATAFLANIQKEMKL